MELVIADPSSSTETDKNSFQTLFTKFSTSTNPISYQEVCQRLLKNLDTDRRTVRFLLKQFVWDAKTSGQRSGNIGRAYERLQQENTQLKQGASSQRLQMEQTIADLQHRVQALNGSLQEHQKKLQEKDTQIQRFRGMYAADGMARVPSSSHSQSSGGKRGRTGLGSSSPRHHSQQQQQSQHQHHQQNQHQLQPPMQGFVMLKQAREMAKEQALGAFSHGPVVSRPGTATDSLITPMQFPQQQRRPLSTGSASSDPRRGGMQMHHQQHQHQRPASTRIRDLSSSTGYVFRSGTSSYGGGGKRGRQEQQQQQSSNGCSFPSGGGGSQQQQSSRFPFSTRN